MVKMLKANSWSGLKTTGWFLTIIALLIMVPIDLLHNFNAAIDNPLLDGALLIGVLCLAAHYIRRLTYDPNASAQPAVADPDDPHTPIKRQDFERLTEEARTQGMAVAAPQWEIRV